jgi:hypothetical protein
LDAKVPNAEIYPISALKNLMYPKFFNESFRFHCKSPAYYPKASLTDSLNPCWIDHIEIQIFYIVISLIMRERENRTQGTALKKISDLEVFETNILNYVKKNWRSNVMLKRLVKTINSSCGVP